MQLRTLKPVSMKEMLAQVRALPLYTHQSAYLWQMCLSVGNQFCDAVVRAGYLSYEQMFSAACRYCVGASKRGGVIFWQIDHEGRVHDGKVMYYLPDCHRNKDKSAHPTWVSALLAKRNGNPKGTSSHCLFGLHQLTTFNLSTDSKPSTLNSQLEDSSQFSILNSQLKEDSKLKNNFQFSIFNSQLKEDSQLSSPVAIVEAEKTAFILSELYPEYIWLASGGLSEVQPEKFRPLRGHRVVMFPDTDPDGIAFRCWNNAAREVMRSVFWEDSPPIRVSPLLELKATAAQKHRKIDILDFLFEQQ